MKAIDLYSGIGGWTLGMKLAGIDVVASYEWWEMAIETHNQNFGTSHRCVDVRQLKLKDLPEDIDFVIGSPPCTQFSFSNRGGQGDLAEGMKDVWKFLEVVEHLKPKYWLFENVPRLAKIVEEELARGSRLNRFAHLIKVVTIVDMSEYGLPQKRKRALVGDFPFELLQSYRNVCRTRTLGDVLDSLEGKVIHDPLYGQSLPRNHVTELEIEPCLDDEESRMNREAKAYHPVYNIMNFPDRLDRPSRTITATCTRVSRESIVVPDQRREGCFRRLNARERATCQGFPITFQFYGKSYPNKLKMIGNAIPPYFTYYLANALLGEKAESVVHPYKLDRLPIVVPSKKPKRTHPDTNGRKFPAKRKFRAALPHLRFGSGVRFELANSFDAGVEWTVGFYHGPSKAYKAVPLDKSLLSEIFETKVFDDLDERFEFEADSLSEFLSQMTPNELQHCWAKLKQGVGPYTVVDLLGEFVEKMLHALGKKHSSTVERFVLKAIYGYGIKKGQGVKKIAKNAPIIFVGMLVGAWFNCYGFERT